MISIYFPIKYSTRRSLEPPTVSNAADHTPEHISHRLLHIPHITSSLWTVYFLFSSLSSSKYIPVGLRFLGFLSLSMLVFFFLPSFLPPSFILPLLRLFYIACLGRIHCLIKMLENSWPWIIPCIIVSAIFFSKFFFLARETYSFNLLKSDSRSLMEFFVHELCFYQYCMSLFNRFMKHCTSSEVLIQRQFPCKIWWKRDIFIAITPKATALLKTTSARNEFVLNNLKAWIKGTRIGPITRDPVGCCENDSSPCMGVHILY